MILSLKNPIWRQEQKLENQNAWIMFQIQVSIKDTNKGYENTLNWYNKRVFGTTSSC